MSMAVLKRRLERLEANSIAADAPCPRATEEDFRPTVVLTYRNGEEPPPVPEDAYPCEECGVPHGLWIHEVVVSTPAEVAALASKR